MRERERETERDRDRDRDRESGEGGSVIRIEHTLAVYHTISTLLDYFIRDVIF